MRKNWFVIIIVIISAFILAGCAPGETEVATSSEPLVQEKPVSAFFMDTCSGCHGPTRQGATGPALLPQRLDQPDEYYSNVILNGKPGTVMPPWGSILSEEDAKTLIAFIRSEPDAGAMQWTFEDTAKTLTVIKNESELPNAPTHSGNIDNLMLVTEREVQSITVIDGDTHQLLTHIPASYRAHGYTFNPVDARWAYNMGRDGWVFKIDLYSLEPVRKVRVGLDSRGIAMSDDGKYIIIGNYIPATAVILNADTLEPLKVISTRAENPEGEMVDSRVAIVSDVSPDLVGPYFIIALKEAGQMWRIDWSDPAFPIAKIENVGHILHDGFLSPDNTEFYVASQTDNWMAVLDVANWTLIEQIETGDTPHPGSGASWEVDGVTYGATVHAAEGKVAVWDMATNEVVGSVDTAGAGLFIRASDHSPYVWADAVFAEEPHHITVFEKTPPFNIVGTIDDGLRTLHPEFTADGAFVYISDWDGNVVRVYNAQTLELVSEIGGITTPTGIFNTDRRHETLGH